MGKEKNNNNERGVALPDARIQNRTSREVSVVLALARNADQCSRVEIKRCMASILSCVAYCLSS